MTVVLKLGGSLVTDKSSREAIAVDRLGSVSRTIAESRPEELLVVHGGGSFGHPTAAEYGVSRTEATRDPEAISAVASAMDRLNRAVVEALVEAGVPAVSIHSGAMSWVDAEGDVRVDPGAIRTLRDEGFVPVARGDIVAWEGHGCAILSGDDLAVALADALEADRIGLCTNVPGVLDAAGNVVERIANVEAVDDLLEDPDGTDVTGGMGHKIRAILGRGVSGAIFGRDDLSAFLEGDFPGTRIEGDAVSF